MAFHLEGRQLPSPFPANENKIPASHFFQSTSSRLHHNLKCRALCYSELKQSPQQARLGDAFLKILFATAKKDSHDINAHFLTLKYESFIVQKRIAIAIFHDEPFW